MASLKPSLSRPKHPSDVSSPHELTPEFFKSKVQESKLMEKYKLEPLTKDTFASKFRPFVEFCTGPYSVTVGYDPVPAVGVPLLDTWSSCPTYEQILMQGTTKQDKKTGYFFYYCYDDWQLMWVMTLLLKFME